MFTQPFQLSQTADTGGPSVKSKQGCQNQMSKIQSCQNHSKLPFAIKQAQNLAHISKFQLWVLTSCDHRKSENMSDLLKAAGFIAFPFIGSIPGGIITKKAMGWYDVSNYLTLKICCQETGFGIIRGRLKLILNSYELCGKNSTYVTQSMNLLFLMATFF